MNPVKRNMRCRAVVVMLGAAFVWCAVWMTRTRAEEVRQVRWSADLQLSSPVPSVIDSALSGPLPDTFEVWLEGGCGARRTIRTCTDFLSIAETSFDTENERDWQLLWAQGLRCVALQWLKNAQPATSSLIDDFRLDRHAADKLPPQLALPVAREEVARVRKAAAACRSLKMLEPSTTTTVQSANKITFEAKGWEADVIEYARGDFDGDGFEDLLLRRDGSVKGGSYSRTNVFLLTRTPKDKCLRVVRQMP
jgi:hypothetical protein